MSPELERMKPGKDLLAEIFIEFKKRGTSFNKWCESEGMQPQTVRLSVVGVTKNIQARKRRQKIFKALRDLPVVRGPDAPRARGNCSQCAYSHPQTASPGVNVCKRFPPALIRYEVMQSEMRDVWLGPVVADTDWCGEWALAERRA